LLSRPAGGKPPADVGVEGADTVGPIIDTPHDVVLVNFLTGSLFEDGWQNRLQRSPAGWHIAPAQS
jgi:hypothetical protein